MLNLNRSLFLAHFSPSHCLESQNVGFVLGVLHLHLGFLFVPGDTVAGLVVVFRVSLPSLPTRTQTIVPLNAVAPAL